MKRKVAIYARVSTEHEAQINALEIRFSTMTIFWNSILNGNLLEDMLMKELQEHLLRREKTF